MNEIYQSLVRALLKMLVGYLVARGLTDDSTAEKLVAALLGLVTVLWGVVSANLAKQHREGMDALFSGPDVVKPAAPAPAKPPGSPLPLILFGLLLLPFVSGCRLGPPDGRITSVTSSVIGISIGQSSADAVPHIQLGYTRQQFHIVPTGTNIFAPAVLNSMSLDNTFSHQVIDEDFATGGATRDVKESSPASVSAKARTAKTAPATLTRTNVVTVTHTNELFLEQPPK